MNKFLAALAIAGVILPTAQPVVDALGGDAAVVTQIGSAVVLASTKAIIDVQAKIAKQKEKTARRRAARR